MLSKPSKFSPRWTVGCQDYCGLQVEISNHPDRPVAGWLDGLRKPLKLLPSNHPNRPPLKGQLNRWTVPQRAPRPAFENGEYHG